MIFFFGADEVEEESEVDEDEVRRRIGSVKYPLESAYIGSLDPMIDRWCPTEAPVGEVGRVSKMEEDGLTEYESDEDTEDERDRRGDQEEFHVCHDRRLQKLRSVLDDQECEEELKIVASTVDEIRETEIIGEGDRDEHDDVPSDQIVEYIELGESLLLIELVGERERKDDQEDLLKIVDPRYPELVPEEYGDDHAPREEAYKDAEDAIEHGTSE